MKRNLKPVPRGFSRWMYRMPIQLYRLGLGGLLGERFLLLTHTGRKSGVPRQTMIEIIRKDTEQNVVYSVAGWGAKADWVKNLQKTSRVRVLIGTRTHTAEAIFLDADQRVHEMQDYATRNPKLAQALPKLLGYELDGSAADLAQFAREIEIIAFYLQD